MTQFRDQFKQFGVPRKLRVEYSGAIYHVMNRGDRREKVFRDEQDREAFPRPLTEACLKTEWQAHAYCLMGNHFHLVLWILSEATGQEKAERMVIAGLKKLKWTETELSEGRKGDPGKIRLARELREETTMSLKWMATRLKMGSWTYVSNLLRSECSSKPLFKK